MRPDRSSEPLAAAVEFNARLAARVDVLTRCYRHVAATRMQGVGLLNPALRVRAVGFEPVADEDAALGVLVTPWFMNLVWLPLAEPPAPLPVGVSRWREIGGQDFEFIGMREPWGGLGSHEGCSLFSPMFEFADAAAAEATAHAVLAQLRPPQPTVGAPVASPEPAQVSASLPARRAFFLGRGSRHA
jgi:[NiFe] hydrogenase assembly HybE family chaperone